MTDALLDPVETWLSSHDPNAEPTLQVYRCAEWLQALVGRLRSMDELRAIDAETVEQTRENFLWAQSEMERLEAQVATLREALQMIAEYNVGANHGALGWPE